MASSSAFSFTIPSSVQLVGPSGCGKTTFLEKALRNPQMWDKPIDTLMYCYGIRTPMVQKITEIFPEAVLCEDMPRNLEQPLEMFRPEKNNVLIFDDLQSTTSASPAFTDFLVRGSHHANVCVISCEHHLFSDAKERRKQANQWQCIILFQNKRAAHQIGTLARQTAIGDPKRIVQAYRDAVSRNWGHLCIDFRNHTPPEFLLMSNVMCDGGEPTYAYL
jgi:ABC-type dipeptide/oligopeptide/nickel transport system ATPase component